MKKAFEAFGQVDSVSVIKDQYEPVKGFRLRGNGRFLPGQGSIEGLNGKDLNGRSLNVNEARPRADKNRGGGFGGNRGGGGGGRGGWR